MTREEALNRVKGYLTDIIPIEGYSEVEEIVKALEQEPCEMTAEDYRQRMMQAFHNADCDELIAVCVLPTEKEFEHLEWLLKNHYKKEPCEDAISRQAVIDILDDMTKDYAKSNDFEKVNGVAWVKVQKLPTVNPQKIGRCDIMNLESIHKLCIEKMCIRCPLFKYEGTKLGNGHCDCLLLTVPANWDPEEIERRLKHYGEKKEK